MVVGFIITLTGGGVKEYVLASQGMGREIVPPPPQGLKKIKRVGVNAFLRLKELVNNVKVCSSITPRGYRKKSSFSREGPVIAARDYTSGYEPSNIDTAYDSLYWSWHRIIEWDRYINDPIENINIKGHMIT